MAITRFKFVMLGDSTVGKTSLVNRYLVDRYDPYTSSTIGASYNTKPLIVNETKIKTDIWDTAGQERYRSLIPLYYRNADCIFICVDLSKEDCLDGVEWWLDEVNSNNKNEKKIIKLIGTKCDIKLEKIDEKIKDYCTEKNLTYVETSSKLNINIDRVFIKTAHEYWDILGLKSEIVKNNISVSEEISSNQWLRFCLLT